MAADDPRWLGDQPIVKRLTVIVKSDQKKLAGKTTVFTGSQLRITEPEFVEWDGDRETYPFVFEAEGDWEVTTSLKPPAGFEVDGEVKKERIVDQLKIIEFTVTGDGKQWKETKVKHKVAHNQKTETVEGMIGIKLSKRLAHEKNKTIFGDTEAPGPFKGGKKVKKDK